MTSQQILQIAQDVFAPRTAPVPGFPSTSRTYPTPTARPSYTTGTNWTPILLGGLAVVAFLFLTRRR